MKSFEEENSDLADEWENAYFTFMGELAKQNASRYKIQAQELIRNRELSLEVNAVRVKYKLDRVGCWFSIIENSDGSFRKNAWNRFGWGKAAKLRALPEFFAKTEAGLLFPSK